jgi:hypothetical protein
MRAASPHHDEAAGLLTDLERIKWLLCHGNQHRAGETIGFFEASCPECKDLAGEGRWHSK